jgi:hypothetical protein
VGQLDLNKSNGTGGGEIGWGFVPVSKIADNNENNYQDLWEDEEEAASLALMLEKKIAGMKEVVGEETRGKSSSSRKVGQHKRVHRVTTWNKTTMSAAVEQKKSPKKSFETDFNSEADLHDWDSTVVDSSRHWDDMMDNLHVFGTALEEHTKEREYKEQKRLIALRARADKPLMGKKWKISDKLDAEEKAFGAGGRRTIPRQYELMRPQSSPEKARRRRGGGREDGSGAMLDAGGRVRPSTSGSYGGRSQATSVAMRLQHAGFFARPDSTS